MTFCSCALLIKHRRKTQPHLVKLGIAAPCSSPFKRCSAPSPSSGNCRGGSSRPTSATATAFFVLTTSLAFLSAPCGRPSWRSARWVARSSPSRAALPAGRRRRSDAPPARRPRGGSTFRSATARSGRSTVGSRELHMVHRTLGVIAALAVSG